MRTAFVFTMQRQISSDFKFANPKGDRVFKARIFIQMPLIANIFQGHQNYVFYISSDCCLSAFLNCPGGILNRFLKFRIKLA